MKKGYFSDGEKAFIKKNAFKCTRIELAQMLNRSFQSVNAYIHKHNIECVSDKGNCDNPYGLSTQEMVVLGMMGQGLSNKEIMGTLFISLSTLKTHIVNIYRKLDIGCNGGSEMRVRAVLKWQQIKNEILEV